MFRNERGTRLYLRDHDVACAGCGYNLRGLKRLRCPECGREFSWQDMKAPEARISWRTGMVDLFGLGVIVGVNVVLVALLAVAVVGFGKGSWFTDALWRLPRGPESISGVLVWVLGASVVAWGAAWELSSVASYRVQQVMAAWCVVLTTFHAIGVVSVMV